MGVSPVHDAGTGTEKSWNWYANESGHFDDMVQT
jgi:hypothetical protein